eukprot:2384250-Amphidinium_carterae.1
MLRHNLRASTSPWPTCSDASQTGGGVCTAVGLTSEGQALLSELRWSAAHRGRRGVILVEVFAKLGAARMALERLG